MTRPLTLPEYRALLADVAGRHGGVLDGSLVIWFPAVGSPLASLWTRPLDLRCGRPLNLPDDPTAALSNLDAARATLERAIAARDELAGVVVDVSRGAP